MTAELTPPLTPNLIRQKVTALLADYLGTYTDGGVAIRVEPPEADRTLAATGVEVIINANAGGSASNSGSNQKHRDKIWTVILINHNRQTSLSRPIELMLAEFQVRRHVPQDSTTTTKERCRFEIFDPTMINAR
jgi:hypothetical protein